VIWREGHHRGGTGGGEKPTVPNGAIEILACRPICCDYLYGSA
jgi:hypothetical protein